MYSSDVYDNFFRRSHSLYITPAVPHVSERQIVLRGSRAIRRDVGVVPRVCRTFGRRRRPSAWRTALSGRRAALTVNSFPKIHVHVAAALQSRSSLAASSAAFVRCCQRFCQRYAAHAGGRAFEKDALLFSSRRRQLRPQPFFLQLSPSSRERRNSRASRDRLRIVF